MSIFLKDGTPEKGESTLLINKNRINLIYFVFLKYKFIV